MTAGHLGEWIASRLFDTALDDNAATEGIDGARELRAAQSARGIRPGIASSVVRKNWDAAEIYPRANCP